ncbi:hypothetical protein H924_00415 [Corynebacterium callunae DSM 20147]|uniref:Uncharacterized protein n=1 Tax=Corynebacterium callunae DSM 20147 TaxID=1121353 RepID=M1UWV1_9CORY|nr:hypothetical protein H924_00415 [Corynebacterium callunae DSM 20147]
MMTKRSLPGDHHRWADPGLLSLPETQYRNSEASPGQGDLRAQGRRHLPTDSGTPAVEHRQMKYLNNVIETDPGAEGGVQKPNVFLPDSERDRSDALLAEKSGDDV